MLNLTESIGFNGSDNAVNVVLHATVNSATASAVIPATIQAGDIAVFIDRTSAASAITPVIPAGFTSIVQSNHGGTNLRNTFSSYKLLTAADSGATVTGMTGSSYSKVLMIFRPMGISVKKVTITDAKEQSGNVNPNPQTLVDGTGLYISFGILVAISLSAFTTYTPAADTEYTYSLTRIGYGIHKNESKTYTIDATVASDTALQSFNVNLS